MKNVILIGLTILAAQLAFANSKVIPGMPRETRIDKKSIETLVCRTQNHKIMITLDQGRSQNELGVVRVWTRAFESANYPDYFDANFNVKKALKDREMIKSFDYFKGKNLELTYSESGKTVQLKITSTRNPADKTEARVNIESQCTYSVTKPE